MQRKRFGIRDCSTMSEKEFLVNHTLCCTTFMFLIDWLLRLIVPGAYHRDSVPSLISCTIAANVAIVVNYRYHRRKEAISQDVLIGMGSYVILILRDYLPFFCKLFIRCMLGGMLVLSVYGSACILSKKINRKNDVRSVVLSRIFSCVRLLKRNVAITAAIAIVLAPIATRIFFNTKLVEDNEENLEAAQDEIDLSIRISYDDSYQLSENFDMIKFIRDNEIFQSLDYEKKQNVLRAIIYCEARYLGLCKINVEFVDTDNESLLGFYNHKTKTIYINRKPIQDGNLPGGTADELLRTVLHECRHVYQILLSECYYEISPSQRNLYAFYDVGEWVDNLKNYKSSDGTIEGQIEYQSQAIELDAEEYSRKEAFIYYMSIDELLKAQAQSDDN